MLLNDIFFSGGPFWELEYYFSLVQGIEKLEVVYVNGSSEDTTYDAVHRGSGHVEAVRLVFNENIINVLDLVRLFIILFDPFSLEERISSFPNYQRIGIYSFVDDDIDEIKGFFTDLEELHHEEVNYRSLYIESFCIAEDEYQEYLMKNPGIECGIGVDKLTRANNYLFNMDHHEF